MDKWRDVWADPRKRRLAVAGILVADIGIILASLTLSVGLAHRFDFPGGPVDFLVSYAIPVALAAAALLAWRRLYRINSRYLGVHDLLNIVIVATVLGGVVAVCEVRQAQSSRIAPELAGPALFALLSATTLSLGRLYQRLIAHRALHLSRIGGRLGRTVIVGAGDAGESLLRELRKLDPPEHYVVGFIDDDPARAGRTIHGIELLGTVADLPGIVESKAVDEILIALPDAVGEDMRRVFDACTSTRARVRTLPSLSRFVRGGSEVLPLMREVEVDDLLRRASVKNEMSRAARFISGERVLITGAGGSIGSELARQIVSLSPASLVLLGKGENSVFEIDQELKDLFGFQATPIVCDIRDTQGLEDVFRIHRPSVVFHAAAHKHVPLMEAVPIEAVRNNVFGTWNVADLSVRYGVQRFILVSTDKAVNPKNVMGATKRVAEMTISAMAQRFETNFSTVRFGNVLGSRGSLIPILKRQIRAGGPVTLTHPEMTRFFMTIPEAVQLIVEAGSMGEKGEVFILEMGEPVSIVELAKDMIRLHGLVPGKDIDIRYTGIRPGEKIHEELAYEREDLLPSDHEKIRVVRNCKGNDLDWLRGQIVELRELCDAGDVPAVRAYLMELAWGKTLPPVSSSGAQSAS